MRCRLLAVAGLAAIACVATPNAGAAAAQTPPYHPSKLAHVGNAGQVIVVTAPDSRSTHATLRAYERDGKGGWRLVVGATPARLGWSGLVRAADRRQGTGKTPAGTFGIPVAFGRYADPGTALPYRQFDRDDAWTYNPKVPSTYNMMQTAPYKWRTYGSYVEHLWSHGEQYRYVAVMDYNLPDGPISRDAHGIRRTANPADTKAGGGIFLHVTDGRSTAGCVAIPQATMRNVLRWLDPQRHPVIVVGTIADIDRM